MSKHATANTGHRCGKMFSTMVNHSALPMCDVLLPGLLRPSWKGMQGAGLMLSMSSATANIGHLSSLESSALKPQLVAVMASTTMDIPVSVCSGEVLNVQLSSR